MEFDFLFKWKLFDLVMRLRKSKKGVSKSVDASFYKCGEDLNARFGLTESEKELLRAFRNKITPKKVFI